MNEEDMVDVGPSALDKFKLKYANVGLKASKPKHSVAKSLIRDDKVKSFADVVIDIPLNLGKQAEEDVVEEVETPTQMSAAEKWEEVALSLPVSVNGKTVFNRVCQHCGKYFSTSIKTKKFCCDDCRITFNARKRLGHAPYVYKRVCKNCGTHFETTNNLQLRCDNCKGAYKKVIEQRKKSKYRRKALRHVPKGLVRPCSFISTGLGKAKVYKITTSCLKCGEKFTYDTKSLTPMRSFCCHKCENDYRYKK